MSDEKTYQQARLAFQRLSPQPGDVIAVSFPDDIAHEQMKLVAEAIQPLASEHECTIICLRRGIELQHISEHRMNELGWFRFNPDSMQ